MMSVLFLCVLSSVKGVGFWKSIVRFVRLVCASDLNRVMLPVWSAVMMSKVGVVGGKGEKVSLIVIFRGGFEGLRSCRLGLGEGDGVGAGVWHVQVAGWESFRPTTRIFWDRISLSLVLRVSLSSEIVVSIFFLLGEGTLGAGFLVQSGDLVRVEFLDSAKMPDHCFHVHDCGFGLD